MRNGKVLSALPELDSDHPLQRPERAASFLAVLNSFPVQRNQVISESSTDQELKEGERTILRSSLSIKPVSPESAKTYAFLDVQQNEQGVQRLEITENAVLVGRADPKQGITPEIDLTQFDTSSMVSRRHARIRLKDNSFYIEDLGSRNKTRVGELTLTPNQPELLSNGDVVSFGSVKATFRLLGKSELPVSWSQS